MEQMYYREMESPVGPLTLFQSEKGVCGVYFGAKEQTLIRMKLNKHFEKHHFRQHEDKLSEAARQLQQYFRGTRTEFQLPLDLRGTPFQLKVWQALSRIPYGETASYKKIAEEIGNPKAVRAVGGANNQNPVSIIIPCHRVIGTNGALVGYGGGLEIKEYLLTIENRLMKKCTS